jgi:DNA-binding PadR family transcriptional regulator
MGSSEWLGTFEQIVLLALVRLRDDAYGRRIHDEVVTRVGRDVAIGQVYTTLDRLADKGMVTSRVGEPTSVRGGRAKRYFEITGLGERALNDTAAALNAMRGNLVPAVTR